MKEQYPQYEFELQDLTDALVRLVKLDNPSSYPFDAYHSHEYSELMFFSKGCGKHSINFIEHQILPASIHHLSAKDIHWLERSADSEGFAIVYKDKFLLKLQQANPSINYIDYFNHSQVIRLDDTELPRFKNLLAELGENEDELYTFSLIGTFFTKLVLGKYNGSSNLHQYNDPLVISFYSLIQHDFKNANTMSYYAAKLLVSESTLNRRIKLATGKTVLQLKQEVMMKAAKQKVVQSEKSLSEIADLLGFHELAHFSNWFKRLDGQCPSLYRIA